MKKKSFILSSLIVSLVFISACKKEIDRNYTEFKFIPSSVEYVQLTPGKYLIYKDSANGDTDSVIVMEGILKTLTWYDNTYLLTYGPIKRFSQYILLGLMEVYAGDWWFYGSAVAQRPMAPLNEMTNAVEKMVEAYSSGVVHNLHYPVTIIPSLTIESKTYTDVVESIAVREVGINDPAYNKSTLYWAKGIGIIKRRVITTGGTVKTYTLIRNN